MEKVLGFFKKYLGFLENGHNLKAPFKWLYGIIAVLLAIYPIVILCSMIEGGFFNFRTFLFWIVIAALCFFGFILWWDRKDKVAFYSNSEKDEFIITPIIAYFIKTAGEWIGTYLAVGGFLFSLMVLLFGGSRYLAYMGLGYFTSAGAIGLALFPIFGFLVIVLARFAAEQFRALASVANNTKK